MIKNEEIKEDLRNPDYGYLHYSIAKREGLRTGDEFEVEGIANFVVGEYIKFRPDINRAFSGFRIKERK
jgi:hypothetical protein